MPVLKLLICSTTFKQKDEDFFYPLTAIYEFFYNLKEFIRNTVRQILVLSLFLTPVTFLVIYTNLADFIVEFITYSLNFLLFGFLHTLWGTETIIINTILPVISCCFAVAVFSLPNPMHALLSLLGVFFSTVLFYIGNGIVYGGFAFLLIYVGAIAVLFLFVIMLLNVKALTSTEPLINYTFQTISLCASVLLYVQLQVRTMASLANNLFSARATNIVVEPTSAEAVAYYVRFRAADIAAFVALYTDLGILFIIITFSLFVALLGAIILATVTTERPISVIDTRFVSANGPTYTVTALLITGSSINVDAAAINEILFSVSTLIPDFFASLGGLSVMSVFYSKKGRINREFFVHKWRDISYNRFGKPLKYWKWRSARAKYLTRVQYNHIDYWDAKGKERDPLPDEPRWYWSVVKTPAPFRLWRFLVVGPRMYFRALWAGYIFPSIYWWAWRVHAYSLGLILGLFLVTFLAVPFPWFLDDYDSAWRDLVKLWSLVYNYYSTPTVWSAFTTLHWTIQYTIVSASLYPAAMLRVFKDEPLLCTVAAWIFVDAFLGLESARYARWEEFERSCLSSKAFADNCIIAAEEEMTAASLSWRQRHPDRGRIDFFGVCLLMSDEEKFIFFMKTRGAWISDVFYTYCPWLLNAAKEVYIILEGGTLFTRSIGTELLTFISLLAFMFGLSGVILRAGWARMYPGLPRPMFLSSFICLAVGYLILQLLWIIVPYVIPEYPQIGMTERILIRVQATSYAAYGLWFVIKFYLFLLTIWSLPFLFFLYLRYKFVKRSLRMITNRPFFGRRWFNYPFRRLYFRTDIVNDLNYDITAEFDALEQEESLPPVEMKKPVQKLNSMLLTLFLVQPFLSESFSLINIALVSLSDCTHSLCPDFLLIHLPTAILTAALPFPAGTLELILLFLPELTLTVMIVYVVSSAAKELAQNRAPKVLSIECWNAAIRGLTLIAGLYTVQLFGFIPNTSVFNGYMYVSYGLTVSKLFVALTSLFVLQLSGTYIREHTYHLIEFSILVLLATLLLFFLVSANNLMLLFFSLAGFSLNMYILILYDGPVAASREAALKYFYLSALSAGLILFGVLLIYATMGDVTYGAIRFNVETFVQPWHLTVINTGVTFILLGFFFKLSVFPGHLWAVEVYEGSPLPVMAFFILPVKVGVFIAFLRLLNTAFVELGSVCLPIITVAALGSLLWGAFAAAQERKTTRFLGYASINQIGLLLLGLVVDTDEALRSTFFYLILYSIMTGGFLLVFTQLRRPNGQPYVFLSHFRGLGATENLLCWHLSVFLFSMAGVPPLAGFFGKYFLLMSIVDKQLYILAIAALAVSLITAYYYLRIIKTFWFEELTAVKMSTVLLTSNQRLLLSVLEGFLWTMAIFAPALLPLLDTVVFGLTVCGDITSANCN